MVRSCLIELDLRATEPDRKQARKVLEVKRSE